MKQKVSISMDNEVLEKIDRKLMDGIFRNRSHFIEYNIKQILEGGRK